CTPTKDFKENLSYSVPTRFLGFEPILVFLFPLSSGTRFLVCFNDARRWQKTSGLVHSQLLFSPLFSVWKICCSDDWI
ncbi:MAG: hypothetical protein K0U34_00050, partial [Alphaproteobacteria bacterium]|nr:hypothetical protein [Alphaproteobacteria bacterium]